MAENNQANAPAQEQDLSEILKVRREKLAALRAEGRDPFQQTRFDVSHHAQDIKDHFDELEGIEVTVGGRLMSKRGMGKVSFCDLQDKSGRIQIYARKDEMDEAAFNAMMARGMNEAEVKAIVDKNISKPFLGVFGTETVNVLELNIALEEADQNK